MELPKQLKELYRHWSYHIIPSTHKVQAGEIYTDIHLFEKMSEFVHERINIWERKTQNAPQPYTKDPILQKYRFCNIFREFDRQTLEFHKLLLPLRDNFPLWLMNMFYCRMVARTETIQNIGLLSYNSEENETLLSRFKAHPSPKFWVPYVFPISTIMRSSTPNRELFITRHLPLVVPKIAHHITQWHKQSVYDGVHEILPLFWYNHSFLWTEVLIDVAYQYPEYIDLFARFPIGPGAKPTFSRINPTIHEASLLAKELALIPFDTNITFEGNPLRLSAENWEWIGCEYRKYTNLLSGGGRKRIFG